MLPVSQQDLIEPLGPDVLGNGNHRTAGVSSESQRRGIHTHYSAPIPPPPFSQVRRPAPTHGHEDVVSAATSIVSLTSNTVCTRVKYSPSADDAQVEAACLSGA